LKHWPFRTLIKVWRVIEGIRSGKSGAVSKCATIGTGPTAQETHWHQVQLVLKEELVVQEGDTATGSLKLDVNPQRGYDIALDLDWSDGTKLQQQWDLSQKPR